MISKTHITKAIEAASGKSTESLRGIRDKSSKILVGDRQVLARIVKDWVPEARSYTVEQLEQYIPGEIRISTEPVERDAAAAAHAMEAGKKNRKDPGAVRQENTEDGTIDEGTVYFDILFTLELPDDKEPILLIINVEVQNRKNLPYALDSRAVDYSCRLVGRQGTDYRNIRKVYSIWVVTDPQNRALENTTRTLVIAVRNSDGTLEPAPSAAQLFEIDFLYLGSPENAPKQLPSLGMLDILFSSELDAGEKKRRLGDNFDIQLTTKTDKELETMQNMELALEARARKKGRNEGRAEGRIEGRVEGKAEGIIETVLAMGGNTEVVLNNLRKQMKWTQKQALEAYERYLAEHPNDGPPEET